MSHDRPRSAIDHATRQMLSALGCAAAKERKRWDSGEIGDRVRSGETVRLGMPRGHEVHVSLHAQGSAIWHCQRCDDRHIIQAVAPGAVDALAQWIRVHYHEVTDAS